MRKITLSIILLLITMAAFAQSYQTITFGGQLSDNPQSIATDAFGNVYITGTFQGTVDFDPGTGTTMLTAHADPNNPDAFIQKLDAAGSLIWVKTFEADPVSITADVSGNIIVTGSFHDSTDFDPGAGVAMQVSTGGNDIFVQKLDASGNLLWVRTFGDSLADDYSRAVTTDILDNVFVTGNYTGAVDFDPSAGTDIHTSNGWADIYIQKMDASGNFQWAKTFGGSSTDYGYSLTTDPAGNVYVTGLFLNTVDFDPGAGTESHVSNGSYDVYIVKLNISGDLLWAKTFGGADDDEAFGVTISPDNTIYIMGAFSGTVDFDPGAGVTSKTVNGMHDVFILEMDNAGNLLWVNTFGGAGDDYAVALAADVSGNIYTTGYYNAIVDFDSGTGTDNHNFTDGDVFVQKLDANGNYRWTKTFGDGAGHATSHAIAAALNTVYVTGYFGSSVDFAVGSAVDTHVSAGDIDAFVWQYSCVNTSATINVTSCHSYLSPAGNTYASSGTYTDVIGNSSGCDSTITINLTIVALDTTLTQNGNTLSSNEPGAVYQWYNCGADAQVYEETSVSFTPSVNGMYAVIISKNGCVDTSECIAFAGTGINKQNAKNNNVTIFPNPGNGVIYMQFGSEQKNTGINIFSADGRLIRMIQMSGLTASVDLTNEERGVYFIETNSNGIKQTHRVVLE